MAHGTITSPEVTPATTSAVARDAGSEKGSLERVSSRAVISVTPEDTKSRPAFGIAGIWTGLLAKPRSRAYDVFNLGSTVAVCTLTTACKRTYNCGCVAYAAGITTAACAYIVIIPAARVSHRHGRWPGF